jgi:hypothetical protein
MTTYTWSINSMLTVQQPDPDYVVKVYWGLTGMDGQTYASAAGSVEFAQNQEQSGFIPYDQLTEAIVVGWVQAALGEGGIAQYEANIQAQIDVLKNPSSIPEYTPLPWAPPAA